MTFTHKPSETTLLKILKLNLLTIMQNYKKTKTDSHTIIPFVKHGGGSHMLRGCSTLTVTGNLIKTDSRMYGAKYMPKQEENLL